MKTQVFVMTRMWAMVTGLVLTTAYFAALYMGFKTTEMMPMLVTAIGGFEIFLFSQDVWLRRKSRQG